MEREDLRHEVKRAAKGNEEAARLLFDHFYPRVFRYALSKLGRRQDAEDVAAETFARVLKGLDRFRWRGAGFEAWIFRIAYNLIVDQYRGGGREHLTEPEEAPQHDPTTPEEVFFRGEIARELGDVLSELSTDQREVLLLRFVAGLDTNEITHIMGRNANAVRQLQFRALETMRGKIGESDD